MRRPLARGRGRCHWLVAVPFVLATATPWAARAGVAYGDPGWDYLYDGAADGFGSGDFGALDGRWRHDQADRWDGSAPGSGAPGGVDALGEGATSYLRIQDTGNPVAWGLPDPSNRRIWFGHDIEDEHPGATSVLTNGITITFRARLSSSGALDAVHPDLDDFEPECPDLAAITPWPAAGKGYNVSDDGQGMFTVQEDGAYAIGFALALDADTFSTLPPACSSSEPNLPGGLVMNNVPESNLPGSDRGRPSGSQMANLVVLSDAALLDWHEFWITIVGTDPGELTMRRTYQIDVYRDGSATPETFQARSSIGAEFDGQYLAFGLSSETSFGAVDVDFFGYALGVVTPAPEPSAAGAALTALGALAGACRRRARSPTGFRAHERGRAHQCVVSDGP